MFLLAKLSRGWAFLISGEFADSLELDTAGKDNEGGVLLGPFCLCSS